MPRRPAPPSAPTVVKRYPVAGEFRPLGIHCIPGGGTIDIEELSDGSLRIASDEPPVEATSDEPSPDDTSPEQPEADAPETELSDAEPGAPSAAAE